MSLAVQAGLFAAGVAVGAVAFKATSSSTASSSRVSASDNTTANDRVSTVPSSSSPSTYPIVPRTPSTAPTLSNASIQASSALASAALRYGFPGPSPDILQRTAYVAAYDRQKRHPAWTAQHLTAATLRRPTITSSDAPLPPSAAGSSSSAYAQALIAQQQERQQIPSGDRANSTFKEDVEIPVPFRARLDDYFRSGYDRGHMVPAADAKRSQEAMDETFLLTNIAPQVGDGFNRHYWAYVEDFCRRMTNSFSDVYVFTVPLYLPQRHPDGKWRVTYEVIGAQSGSTPSIAVPTHFAKVLLASKPVDPSQPLVHDTSLGAFVLPNAPIPDETPFETFKVPIEAVESAAGLTLFSPAIKNASKELCKQVKCDLIVRRFDDAAKGQRSRRNSTSSVGSSR